MKKRILKQWPLLLALFITAALSAGGQVAFAMYLSWLVDSAVAGGQNIFGRMIIIGLCFLAVGLIVLTADSAMATAVKNRILEKTRTQLFEDIYSQNMVHFGKVNTSEYLSQMTNDMQIVENSFLTPFVNIFENVVCIVASTGLILYYEPVVLLVIAASLIAIFLVPALMGVILQKKQKIFSDRSVIFTNRMKDLFSGYEVIASAERKEEAKQEFRTENRGFSKTKKNVKYWSVANTAVSVMLGLGVQMSVMLACVWYIMQGSMTVGTLLMLVQVMNIFVSPVANVMGAIPQMKGVRPVIQKMEKYIKETRSEEKIDFTRTVVLNRINFSYTEDAQVLEDVTLSVEKGKKYAIVGASGCGKSNMLKVLSGYFEDYIGEITVDGKAVDQQESGKLFSLCAFIHQNVFLLDKSIRENICLYRNYSEKEMQEAIEKSGVAKFLDGELTLEDKVGEKGSLLSGGQKQRIAIARALIQNKPIILLDEGTSALDPQTAGEIECELLENPAVTLLTITHHFQREMMEKYDEVVYMQEGKLWRQELTTS